MIPRASEIIWVMSKQNENDVSARIENYEKIYYVKLNMR